MKRPADRVEAALTRAKVPHRREQRHQVAVFSVALEGRADLHLEVSIIRDELAMYVVGADGSRFRGILQDPRDVVTLVRAWRRRAAKGRTP